MSLALSGCRILVTRSAHQAGKLSDGLRALGAEPIEVPVLEIQPPASFDPLDAALRHIERYDWLVLTSANAVRVFVERTAALGISPAEGKLPEIAAVGAATADAARDAGLDVALVPPKYVAESLIESLANRVANRRILLARAEIARDVIPDALRRGGAEVDVVDAYRNALPDSAPLLLRDALGTGLDAATFTSSSSVTHLAQAAAKARLAFPFAGVAAISIGPVTSATLRELNWLPAGEASPHDIPGLIAAVAHALGRNR